MIAQILLVFEKLRSIVIAQILLVFEKLRDFLVFFSKKLRY